MEPSYCRTVFNLRTDKIHIQKDRDRGNSQYRHNRTRIEQERQLDKMDGTNGETNPYKELIANNAEKIEPLMTQMEQWSILSNILNYIQHSRLNSMNHMLAIKAVDKYKYRPNKDTREFIELYFGATAQKLQEEYMDIYEGIHSEVVSSNRCDENSDISTKYLERVDNENQHKLKAEESFPISEHSYTLGRLLDVTECQLLLDMGTSKSFMSKAFTCNVSCSTLYQNLLQEQKVYKLETVNVLVCFLLYQ